MMVGVGSRASGSGGWGENGGGDRMQARPWPGEREKT